MAVVIQPAGNLVSARMRTALAGVTGDFHEGYELDAKTAKKVPKALIGKVLSRGEATPLLRRLGK